MNVRRFERKTSFQDWGWRFRFVALFFAGLELLILPLRGTPYVVQYFCPCFLPEVIVNLTRITRGQLTVIATLDISALLYTGLEREDLKISLSEKTMRCTGADLESSTTTPLYSVLIIINYITFK